MDAEFSPELALVSPDVAERARAALPDRPWEAFARPHGPIERIGPPTPRTRETDGSRWVERVANAFPLVMLAGLIALLIVGSLPGLSKGPTLAPPSTTHPVQPAAPVAPAATAVPRGCGDGTVC